MTHRMMSPVAKWVLGALLLAAPLLHGQMLPFDVEVGYRWFDVSGNEGMYRTQINERSGFLIRRLTLATGDFDGRTSVVDRFRLDVSDLGVGPAGSVRLEADRAGLYKLRLAYRGTEAFSELPAFANPLLAQGVTPGQHTYDRTRRMFDVDLDFLPGAAIAPFVGYTWNDGDSQGLTTYHLGQDEFVLSQDLQEEDRELRVGADFRYGTVAGRITQGWRSFDGTESLALAGPGAGNNGGAVLGQPVQASTINRNSSTDGSTPFTTFFVSGQLAGRLRATGNLSRFAADSDTSEGESASGAFASFALGRFYNGLTGLVQSNAQNETWRGGGRVEYTVAPSFDLTAGFDHEQRELDGTALINTLFVQSITFGGVDRRDLATILEATSSIERDSDTFHVAASARSVGPFAFRAEVRNQTLDVTVAPDLAEIVVPGAQGGSFERSIRTFDGSAAFNHSGFNFGIALRRDRADDVIFRTDFLDRDRLRVRGSWSSPAERFRIGVMAEDLDQDNRNSDIAFDAETKEYSADVQFAPVPMVRLYGSVSQFRTDSSVLIRRPENFSIVESIHKENGKSREVGVVFQRAALALDAGFTKFENEGSLPFDLDRARLRVSYDFKAHAGVALEWNQDEYEEPSPSYGAYDATRYGLYLRWRP